MYPKLYDFLEKAADNGARVEVITTNNDRFTGVSNWESESFDGDFGWDFKNVKGVNYQSLPFGDIARVRLVGSTEWAWEYDQAQATSTRELELAV
ncbi:MAG: hypothetical protein FWG65_03210 [Turicibacter sp.]|nr:hypothetical protein [Turicibacter sp.]